MFLSGVQIEFALDLTLFFFFSFFSFSFLFFPFFSSMIDPTPDEEFAPDETTKVHHKTR